MAMPNLWPKAPYTPWLAPGAKEKVEAEYGPGLDRGALREGAAHLEILWAEGRWVPFKPGSRGHMEAANHFARLGPGYSAGHHPETMHASGDGYYEQVTGKKPDPMLAADLNFNETLFREWQQKATQPSAPTPPPSGETRQILDSLARIELSLAKLSAGMR